MDNPSIKQLKRLAHDKFVHFSIQSVSISLCVQNKNKNTDHRGSTKAHKTVSQNDANCRERRSAINYEIGFCFIYIRTLQNHPRDKVDFLVGPFWLAGHMFDTPVPHPERSKRASFITHEGLLQFK